jgi:hypothetical protein
MTDEDHGLRLMAWPTCDDLMAAIKSLPEGCLVNVGYFDEHGIARALRWADLHSAPTESATSVPAVATPHEPATPDPSRSQIDEFNSQDADLPRS